MALLRFDRIRSVIITLSIISLFLLALRQLFDFLGRLWTPILLNFSQIIVTFFAYFGALQYRRKILLCYSIWTILIWLSWNTFLICFYLNVGILRRDNTELLNFSGSKNMKSWWWKNMPHCEQIFNATTGLVSVRNCLIDYYYVEVATAGVHIVLALSICLLVLIFAIKFNQKYRRTYESLPRRPRPRITVELNAPKADEVVNVDTSFDGFIPTGIGTTGTGYSNASYDGSPANRVNGALSAATATGCFQTGSILRSSGFIQNYRRASNQRNSAANHIHNNHSHIHHHQKQKRNSCPNSSALGRRAKDRSRDYQPNLVSVNDTITHNESIVGRRRSLECDRSDPDDVSGPVQMRQSRRKSVESISKFVQLRDQNRLSEKSNRMSSSNTHQSPIPYVNQHQNDFGSISTDQHNDDASSPGSEQSRLPPSTVYSYSMEPKRRVKREVPVPKNYHDEESNGHFSATGPDRTSPMAEINVTDYPDRAVNNCQNRRNAQNTLFTFNPKFDPKAPSAAVPPVVQKGKDQNLAVLNVGQLLRSNLNAKSDELDETVRSSFDSGLPPSWKAPTLTETLDTTSRNSMSYNRELNKNVINDVSRDGNFSSRQSRPINCNNVNSSHRNSKNCLSYNNDDDELDNMDYLKPNSARKLPNRTNNVKNVKNSTTENHHRSQPFNFSHSKVANHFDPFESMGDGPVVPKISDKSLVV